MSDNCEKKKVEGLDCITKQNMRSIICACSGIVLLQICKKLRHARKYPSYFRARNRQVRCAFSNGLVTNASWKCDSVKYPGWSFPGFDDSTWPAAVEVPTTVICLGKLFLV